MTAAGAGRSIMPRVGRRVAAALFALTFAAAAAATTPPIRLYRMPDGIGGANDAAGQSVGLRGDTAIVAANGAHAVAGTSGAIALFRNVGGAWQREAILVPAGANCSFDCTYTVALGEDLAVVSLNGSIHTFARNAGTWTEVDQFVAGSGVIALSGDRLVVDNQVYARSGNGWQPQGQPLELGASEFVVSAAIDGDVVALGTHALGFPPPDEPHVSFYSRSTGSWVREYVLDLDVGAAVSVSGQTVLVGGAGSANAYVRDQGQWTLQGPLDPLATLPTFGASVALEGDRAVVSSPGDTVFGIAGAGTVYVFERSGGTWSRTGHVADLNVDYYFEAFGTAVALSGDTFLAGAPGANSYAGISAGNAQLFALQAGDWEPAAILDFGNAYRNENFGSAVAASASRIVVAASSAPARNPLEAGAVDIYERAPAGWTFDTRLRAPSGARGFASSVAMSADTVAAGAPLDDTSGAVYVFERGDGSWPLQARLDGGSAGADGNVNFGWSVALSGDRLAAGEPGRMTDSTTHGLVRTFERAGTNWSAAGIVQAADGAVKDRFGIAVALDGDTLAIGAPGNDVGIEQDAGAVYVFVASGPAWSLQQKITAPTPATNNGFGAAIALVGDTLVIGARDEQSARGSAYAFARSAGTWTLQGVLAVPLPVPDAYAQSVALSPDAAIALIGAPQGNGGLPGFAYAFMRSGSSWTLASTLQSPPPAQAPDGFGVGTAFAGDDAVIGAPGYGDGGSVFVAPMGDAIFADGFEQP
jgi:hypothetical protein